MVRFWSQRPAVAKEVRSRSGAPDHARAVLLQQLGQHDLNATRMTLRVPLQRRAVAAPFESGIVEWQKQRLPAELAERLDLDTEQRPAEQPSKKKRRKKRPAAAGYGGLFAVGFEESGVNERMRASYASIDPSEQMASPWPRWDVQSE